MRTHRLRSWLLPAALLAALTIGCDSPVDPDEGLRAAVVGDSLRLQNATRQPIYFFAVDDGHSALISWAPCNDPRLCRPVDPESALMIPLTDVSGFQDDSDVVLAHWWYLVPRDGTYEPDQIRTAVARR